MPTACRRMKDDTHLSTSAHETDGVVSRLSTLLPFEAQTIIMAVFLMNVPCATSSRALHPCGIVLLKTVIIVMHLGITSKLTCLQASLRCLLSANMEHNTD